jgi:hypothetical protein
MVYIDYVKTLLLKTGQGRITIFCQVLRDTFAKGRVETGRLNSLDTIKTAPELTVIQLDNETEPSEIKAMSSQLASLQTRAPQESFVVFGIDRGRKVRSPKGKAMNFNFDALLESITGYMEVCPNPDRVDIAFWHRGPELAAKLRVIEAKMNMARDSHLGPREGDKNISSPRLSPLDQIKEAVAATSDLRAPSGKLSAQAVANAFRVTLSELAGWLGRSRQAINKTPDADSLQDGLSFFERVARLRTVLSKDDFLKWLRMRNRALDDKQPLELLASGKGQVVADLVDDMLTGAPA